jgi:predicted nuclease of predicted toxin-antitoxin system
MNLSPDWAAVLREAGHEAEHWASVGSPKAPDREILAWARERGYVVFTHDLDFGAILASTGTRSPSVLQVRTQEITPTGAGDLILDALSRFEPQLAQGALVSLDEGRARVRILPIG